MLHDTVPKELDDAQNGLQEGYWLSVLPVRIIKEQAIDQTDRIDKRDPTEASQPLVQLDKNASNGKVLKNSERIGGLTATAVLAIMLALGQRKYRERGN